MARSAPNCWRRSSGWWKARPRCWSELALVKYVLWGIVGLVAIVTAFLGVGYYWTTHAKVDFKDQQVAGNFKQTFNDNCIHTAQNRAKQSGVTLTAEQLDK